MSMRNIFFFFFFKYSHLLAMVFSSVCSKLENTFKEAASDVDGSGVKQLFKPGVAGLQVLIESVLGPGKVAAEDVKDFFKEKKWELNCSLTWEDFSALVLSLNFPELRDAHKEDIPLCGEEEYDALATQIATLVDKIAERRKS